MTAIITSARMRPLAGESDFQPMVALLRASLPTEFHYYPSPGDIKQWMGDVDASRNFRLWEDSATGRVIAFGTMHYPYCNLHFFVHPDARSEELILEQQIVDWAAGRMREYNAEKGETNTLDTCARADCDYRMDANQRLGFAPAETPSLRYGRSLLTPLEQPHFPADFTIRHVAGEHEAELYAALHRDAFKSESMTTESKLQLMRKPTYQPDLDLIAIAPDGTWAAFCTCDIDPLDNAMLDEKVGWTDPIGVREAYRGLGLARNLILLGFHKLQALGMERAVLGTSSENTRAHYVYESVGYNKLCEVNWFAKGV